MVELLVFASLGALAVSIFVALVSGVSQLMTRRHDGSRYRDIVGFNPPAALMTLYGRAWRYACLAVALTSAATVVSLAIKSLA